MATYDKTFPSEACHGGRIRRTEAGRYVAERSDAGRIRRTTFDTLAEARKHLSTTGARRDKLGQIATALTGPQAADALDALAILDGADLRGVTLRTTADFYAKHHRPHVEDWTFSEALARHLADMERPNDASEPSRPESYKSKRRMVTTFETLYGAQSIRSITDADVKAWVRSFGDIAPKTRMNRLMALQSVFNWTERHLPGFENTAANFPSTGRKRKKTTVHILTAQEAEKLLRYFEKHAPPRYTATLALLLFAGIRPYELMRSDSRLTWGHIRVSEGRIEMPGTETKTGFARTVPIQPNLREWLLRYGGSQGRVAPCKQRFGKLRRAACKAAKIEWVNDSPRHSFASYAGEIHGLTQAAEWLGHVSGLGMFLTHYKGVTTPEEARRYFNIEPLPAAGAKIIRMEATA